jgi:hypothetical protein
MKTAFLLLCLSLSTISFAQETQTECQAMNGEREENNKVSTQTVKTNVVGSKGL